MKVWTWHLCDIASTLPEKQLLVCYWALVETELIYGDLAMTLLPDISI